MILKEESSVQTTEKIEKKQESQDYSAPKLTVYGSVSQLTAAGSAITTEQNSNSGSAQHGRL